MMRSQRGQVGLLILVVMGVLVSLSLSVASRSLSDILLSRQESEGSEAFHVAEQGVEEALNAIRQDSGLISGGTYTGSIDSGLVTGSYTVVGFEGLDIFVREGEVAEIDLTGYPGGPLDLFWTLFDNPGEDVDCIGEGSGNAPAAVEIITMFSASDPVTREYYNASNCALANNFDLADDPGNGQFRSTVGLDPLGPGATKVRVRPIYNGATFGVLGLSLPSQLYLIHSSAIGPEAQKEIEVRRTNSLPGSIFDFALFTGGSIVK